jgi:predicted deacylase
MAASRIWTDVDLDAEGKAFGHFRVPQSGHDSAYGWIPIPFGVIRRGEGPRVLLVAGNHGDEYEGQVILMSLLRDLAVEDVQGQIIIVPGANAPAVAAGRRTSPLDDGNLNRCFPGDPEGSPTEMIAHFFETVLLPRVDVVIDLHSGGSSLEYMPSAVICRPRNDPERFAKLRAMLESFAMPTGLIVDGSTGGGRGMIGGAQRHGVLHLSTELGGGGTVDPGLVRQARQGLDRLLFHVGALARPRTAEPPPAMRLLYRLPTRDYVHAMESGIFEPLVDIGDTVEAGQTGGLIHFPATPWRKPEPIVFKTGGIVLCKRIPARTMLGDCVFNLARPWRDDETPPAHGGEP